MNIGCWGGRGGRAHSLELYKDIYYVRLQLCSPYRCEIGF
jgi:hypothetical protein